MELRLRDGDRISVLRQVSEGVLSAAAGAARIKVTPRQFRRLRRRFEAEGDESVVHGLRGRPSNRALPAAVRERVLEVASGPTYRDFGPTLLAEHMEARFGLRASPDTVRRWMQEAGLWERRRKRARHRRRRERRAALGEPCQWDSSIHACQRPLKIAHSWPSKIAHLRGPERRERSDRSRGPGGVLPGELHPRQWTATNEAERFPWAMGTRRGPQRRRRAGPAGSTTPRRRRRQRGVGLRSGSRSRPSVSGAVVRRRMLQCLGQFGGVMPRSSAVAVVGDELPTTARQRPEPPGQFSGLLETPLDARSSSSSPVPLSTTASPT